MVKAQYVVITVQVDMNLIAVSERIMELQSSKKMMMMMMKKFRLRRRLVPIVNAVLEEFTALSDIYK